MIVINRFYFEIISRTKFCEKLNKNKIILAIFKLFSVQIHIFLKYINELFFLNLTRILKQKANVGFFGESHVL